MLKNGLKLLLALLSVLIVINISSCAAPVSYSKPPEEQENLETNEASDTEEEIKNEKIIPEESQKSIEPTEESSSVATETTTQEIVTDNSKETTASETTQTNEESTSGFETAVCIRVIDGDTIEIKDRAGNTYKVRYIGIDTPEKGDPYFNEATQANSSLVLNKELRLEKDVSETDKYGRLLRYVYVGDLFINAHLVAEGFAQASTYPPDVKYADYFLKLQRQAREQGKGLWGITETTAETPKATEEVTQTTTETTQSQGPFVGSKNSNVYHYPSCPSAQRIKEENKIWFNSVEEAKAAGYRPCKVCKPPE
jgi:micrococcal nuclease